MKNLFDELCGAGLTAEEAEKSIQVVYKWVEDRYPMMAAVAKSTIIKESNIAVEEAKETF